MEQKANTSTIQLKLNWKEYTYTDKNDIKQKARYNLSNILLDMRERLPNAKDIGTNYMGTKPKIKWNERSFEMLFNKAGIFQNNGTPREKNSKINVLYDVQTEKLMVSADFYDSIDSKKVLDEAKRIIEKYADPVG